jgi:hypothetical protein
VGELASARYVVRRSIRSRQALRAAPCTLFLIARAC